MSKKNKPWHKTARRAARGENFPRTPLSEWGPYATKALAHLKYKATAKLRKKLALQRGAVVEIPRPRLTHPAVKLALKLSKLPLEKLHRRLAQSARRASTIKEILSDMVPGSQFAAQLEAEHINQISIFKQVSAEIFSRK